MKASSIALPASSRDAAAPPADARAERAAAPRIVMVQTQAEGAGAQEISRILGLGLQQRGYDVHHVFFFRRTAAYDDQPNTTFCAMQRPSGPLGLARMLAAYVRLLRRLRPDAVVCFQHYGNIIGGIGALFAGVRALIANRTSPRAQEPAWTRALDVLFGMTGIFRRIVVNSKAVADEYRAHPGPYRNRLIRIDHGFEPKLGALAPAAARAKFGLPQGVVLLGCAARLHPSKNLELPIHLLTEHADWHLAIAGQGTAQASLRELTASLKVEDRVHFLGELSPADVGEFFRALDVFVFPSLMETFGLAVVEAAQAGVPVVVNSLEVLQEVLAFEGKPCALFASAADREQFDAAIVRLLADEQLRTELTKRAAGLAERYSLDGMVTKYDVLLADVLRSRVAEPAS